MVKRPRICSKEVQNRQVLIALVQSLIQAPEKGGEFSISILFSELRQRIGRIGSAPRKVGEDCRV